MDKPSKEQSLKEPLLPKEQTSEAKLSPSSSPRERYYKFWLEMRKDTQLPPEELEAKLLEAHRQWMAEEALERQKKQQNATSADEQNNQSGSNKSPSNQI